MELKTLISEAVELLNSPTSEEELIEKQIRIEEEADGYERELREGKRLKDVLLRPTDDPMAQRIISAVFGDMAEYFEEELAKTVRGSGAKYRKILRGLDTEVLVATVLAHSMDELLKADSMTRTVQRLGSKIGRGIVTEVKTQQAFDLNPLYMQRVEEGLKRRNARAVGFIRNVYDAAFDTVTLGKLEYDLNSGDYIHIGKFGLEAMMYAGLIQHETLLSKGRKWSVYNIVPDIYDYIMATQPEIHKRAMSAMFRYMIVKPDDWKGMTGGGFKSVRRKMYHQLISLKGLNKELFQEYRERFTPEKMPKVFNFINYVQSTPFRINADVVNLVREIYQQGGGAMGIPDRNDPEEPKFPFEAEWDKATASEEELTTFNAWKFAMSRWYEDNLQRRQKNREMHAFFRAVQEDIPEMYFPCFFDFRGRLYYNSNPSPQGSDIARACLNFAERKPLGDRGLYWLKVHLANSLGVDKARFDARVEYVDSIWDKLEVALEDPVNHTDAFGDEAPLSAYGVALEIKRAIDSGDPSTFYSGIPVHMDATVSGTQHFSAMLKDEVGAEYTNLIDLGQPNKADLYSRVGELTIEAMNKEEDPDLMDSACWWVHNGIPRDLAKKPVMTYTYGVTKSNITQFVEGFLKEEVGDYPENRRARGDSSYLTNKLFDAIEGTIPATVQGMAFLQDVARDVGHSKMEWHTPSGFWVHFNAKKQDSKRIAVRSAGVDLVWIRVTLDETHRSKMISGVAPQYVHGNDAAHLCLVGNRAKDEGLSIVCIHDSIATHPSDVDTLHKVIREEFVDMYSEDVLDTFRTTVGSTVELPQYGNFDLNHVLNSEFFFC